MYFITGVIIGWVVFCVISVFFGPEITNSIDNLVYNVRAKFGLHYWQKFEKEQAEKEKHGSN